MTTPIGGHDYRGLEWWYLNDICRVTDNSRQLRHPWMVSGVAFSPDGRLLATCELGGCLRVWNATTLAPMWQTPETVRPGTSVLSMAFRRAGQQVVSGGRDGTVRIWDVATGKERQRHFVGEKEVFCVAVHPRSNLVAFGRRVRYSNDPAEGDSGITLRQSFTGDVLSAVTDRSSWGRSLPLRVTVHGSGSGSLFGR